MTCEAVLRTGNAPRLRSAISPLDYQRLIIDDRTKTIGIDEPHRAPPVIDETLSPHLLKHSVYVDTREAETIAEHLLRHG